MPESPFESDVEPVFCSCGAQWHGKVVVKAAATIEAHKQRWKEHSLRCWSVSHDWFRKRFSCTCNECVQGRKQKRLDECRDPVVELERAAWARSRSRTEAAKRTLYGLMRGLEDAALGRVKSLAQIDAERAGKDQG